MSESFDGTALSWARTGDVIEARLHHAPLNEIGVVLLDELERLVAALGDTDARALILASDRPGFCAGADLRALHDALVGGAGVDDVRTFLARVHAVFDALDTAPLTTIAVVHGVCFGGGFELALCCDVIVAEKSARFAFPELRLGLIPGFGGVPRLRREVGNGVVRDLLLTGRSLNASRAHGVGLVSQVVPKDRGRDVARSVAAQAVRYDPEVVRAAKAFTKPIPTAELAEEQRIFCRLVARPAVREALARFVASTDVRPYL